MQYLFYYITGEDKNQERGSTRYTKLLKLARRKVITNDTSAMAARQGICKESGRVPLKSACACRMTESPDQPRASEANESERGSPIWGARLAA